MSEYELALNALYKKLVGCDPVPTDTGRYIVDQIKCDWWTVDTFILDLEKLFTDKPMLLAKMKEQINSGFYKEFYKDPAILVIYYMLKRRLKRLTRDWPLDRRALILFANDLGISLDEF